MSKVCRAVTTGLLPTHQAALRQVVWGMLVSRWVILAERTRGFETPVAFVHNLTRVFRSGDNERIRAQRRQEVVAGRSIHELERRLQLKPGQPLR